LTSLSSPRKFPRLFDSIFDRWILFDVVVCWFAVSSKQILLVWSPSFQSSTQKPLEREKDRRHRRTYKAIRNQGGNRRYGDNSLDCRWNVLHCVIACIMTKLWSILGYGTGSRENSARAKTWVATPTPADSEAIRTVQYNYNRLQQCTSRSSSHK
jgi:hypothetical protein